MFLPCGTAGLQEHNSSSQQQDFLSQRQGFDGWTIIITSSTGSTIWVGCLSAVQKLPSSAFSLGGKGSSSSPNSPLLGLKVWVQRNRNCFYFHQYVRFSSVSDVLLKNTWFISEPQPMFSFILFNNFLLFWET